jgi:hypothetical protein
VTATTKEEVQQVTDYLEYLPGHRPTPRPFMTAHVEGMADVERLLAVEEIKQLKARYFRCMDTKDYAGFEAVFAPDVSFDLREAILARDPHTGEIMKSGNLQITEDQIKDEHWLHTGPEAVRVFERGLEHVTSTHHGHCPEIEILTPTLARGLWMMEDRHWYPTQYPESLQRAYGDLWWLPKPEEEHGLHGFGVYHELYERIDGRWLIKRLVLKRIKALLR